LIREKKLDDGIAEFRQSIKLNANYAGSHRDLGAALGMKGDSDGQIAEEKKALQLAPEDADAYFYLGSALAFERR